jgi:hypothetical protein
MIDDTDEPENEGARSSNYLNVKAIFHQSLNEKITFADQIKNIQGDKMEALRYENEKNALKKRHGTTLTVNKAYF